MMFSLEFLLLVIIILLAAIVFFTGLINISIKLLDQTLQEIKIDAYKWNAENFIYRKKPDK